MVPAAPPVSDDTVSGVPTVPACDPGGVIWTRLSSGAGGVSITGSTPTEDALNPNLINALDEKAFVYGFNGVTWDRLESLSDNADNQAALTLGLLATIARQQAWNGATWERIRTPNVFKTAQVTEAGTTALWTPAAGKKFRLMGYMMLVSSNTVTNFSGTNLILLLDNAAATGISFNPYFPNALVIASATQSVQATNIGNGYLSTAANNVLNVNLVAAITGGSLTFNVWGTEE